MYQRGSERVCVYECGVGVGERAMMFMWCYQDEFDGQVTQHFHSEHSRHL